MDFQIGPLSIRVLRSKLIRDSSTLPSLTDVKSVNDDHLDYVRRLSKQEIENRLDRVKFSVDDDVESIRKCLQDNGIVVATDFINSEILDLCAETVSELKTRVYKFVESDARELEDDYFLCQKGAERLKSYNELSSYPKTVIQVREGQDQGMIDVFNVDKAYSNTEALRAAYEDSILKHILFSDDSQFECKNLNFYINENITNTRGFHVDSYTPQIKSFVYLTDCVELDDGPYSYVIGSHQDSAYRRLNKELSANLPNRTEAPLLNRDDIVPVLAKKGSLVISDQSGFHRGFPQSVGRQRALSVMNIRHSRKVF